MPRKPAEPRIEVRRYPLTDGTVSETYSVRYFDAFGRRRRKTCASPEEAEFERARVVLERSRNGGSVPGAASASDPDAGGLTVGQFWVSRIADARTRLQRATVKEYERVFRTRLEQRFGALPLDDVKPRMVSQWRAELMAEGTGPEAVRRAMTPLQAMYSVAIEWGEANANPVSVVRKLRQGRRRAVQPIAPEGVEALRRVIGDLRSATIVSVLAYAGLRPGEALALELRHMRERTILVEQAVSDGELKVQKTGRAYRTVDLLPPLASDLAAWSSAMSITDPDIPTRTCSPSTGAKIRSRSPSGSCGPEPELATMPSPYPSARVAVDEETWDAFRLLALRHGISLSTYLGRLVVAEAKRRRAAPVERIDPEAGL